MKARLIVFALCLVPFASTTAAAADSPLEAAAKRERARRARNRRDGVAPVRVVTQGDVRTNDRDDGSPHEPEKGGGAADDAALEKQRRADEREWRARARAARAKIAAARARLDTTPATRGK